MDLNEEMDKKRSTPLCVGGDLPYNKDYPRKEFGKADKADKNDDDIADGDHF